MDREILIQQAVLDLHQIIQVSIRNPASAGDYQWEARFLIINLCNLCRQMTAFIKKI